MGVGEKLRFWETLSFLELEFFFKCPKKACLQCSLTPKTWKWTLKIRSYLSEKMARERRPNPGFYKFHIDPDLAKSELDPDRRSSASLEMTSRVEFLQF